MPRHHLLHGAPTQSAITAFHESYDHMGYGFHEPLCAAALERELLGRGHRVGREVNVTVHYKGVEIGVQRLDMLVDDVLVVEIECQDKLHPSGFRQLHNHLRATNLELGLLVNFGPKPQFQRVIFTNDHKRHRVDPSDADRGGRPT